MLFFFFFLDNIFSFGVVHLAEGTSGLLGLSAQSIIVILFFMKMIVEVHDSILIGTASCPYEG